MNPLSSSSLINVLENVKCLKRVKVIVCAADELLLFVSYKPTFIVVNNKSSHHEGEHWLAMYFPSVGRPEFFDSLGRGVKYYHTSFENLLVRNGPNYIENKYRLQNYNTNTCGMYCVYFGVRRCNGVSFENILNKFYKERLIQNEYVIEMFYEIL